MSLLITVEKLYFMDGIYRVTAQTEKPLNPDVSAYVTHLTIEIVKPTRTPLSPITEKQLLNYACDRIKKEYQLATLDRLDCSMKIIRYHFRKGWEAINQYDYPDYRQAIEGVDGVYLTD